MTACLLGMAAACNAGTPSGRDTTPAAVAAPARVIDSILPIAEHLQRFRAGLEPVDTLSGGFGSRDSLVAAMIAATAASDTTALLAMQLTAAEYAWRYYPAHIYSAPPYELDPGTFWMMIQANSEKGLKRLLQHRGGRRLALQGYRCEVAETVRPPVREWNQCTVQLTVEGTASTEQVFGSIVEVGGRFKLVSFANQF